MKLKTIFGTVQANFLYRIALCVCIGLFFVGNVNAQAPGTSITPQWRAVSVPGTSADSLAETHTGRTAGYQYFWNAQQTRAYIAAHSSSYSAGYGLSLTGTTFKLDTTLAQTILNFFPKGDIRYLKLADSNKKWLSWTYYNTHLPATLTASNGLTKVANDLQLGGMLSAPVDIEIGANGIQYNANDGGSISGGAEFGNDFSLFQFSFTVAGIDPLPDGTVRVAQSIVSDGSLKLMHYKGFIGDGGAQKGFDIPYLGTGVYYGDIDNTPLSYNGNYHPYMLTNPRSIPDMAMLDSLITGGIGSSAIQNQHVRPQASSNYWIDGDGKFTSGINYADLNGNGLFNFGKGDNITGFYGSKQIIYQDSTGAHTYYNQQVAIDTVRITGDVPLKITQKLYSVQKPTEPTQVARWGDVTPALAQKDTIGSLMNYHFNGFTTVNSDPWDEAIAGLVQESDSTLVVSYVVDSMIVRAPSYGSSTAVQGLRYNLNTHKWSSPFVIYSNQPDHYSLFSSGGVGVTTNKRQFVFFRRSDGVTGVPIDVGYIYSDDRWATHSTYAAISGTSVTSTYGKMTKGTGAYFKTLYGVNKCELLISTDSTTWSYYSTPYSYGSDPADGALNEPFIKTIGTDSILLVTRTANGRYWQYLSVDNGATFTFINKLPQPTFPLTSAISPEIIYDKKKKKILVLVADRILQNNTRAFNKDKMVLYAEGKDLNAKIINEIQRPAVNGRPLGGYSSTVQLTDSTFFGVATEIKSQDTTLTTAASATIQNLYSYTIKYSDNNLYQNNIPGGGQIPYFNAKNGNWETISYPNQAFYFDPVTNTISPIQDARFLLNGKVTTVDFLEYNRNKSAFSGGRSTDLTQYNDSNIGNYSFSWGNQSKAKGNKSFAFGSNVTATGVGSWAIRDTTAVTALNPALNNTVANSFSAYMAGGYTLATDTSNRLTFTGGQLNIHAQTLSAFVLDRSAGSIGIIFRQGGIDRSRITSLTNGDVTWGAYNSSGTLLNVPITITNSTGVVTFVAAPIISTATATSLAGFGSSKQLQTITALPSTTTATTPAAGDNTTKVATTAFVQSLVSPALTVSSASTLSPTAGKDYVFNGTIATWTLPAVSANTGRAFQITIKNAGSGILTVNSNAGGNDIYDTSAVATIAIAAGGAVTLMPGTTLWYKE